MNVSGSSWCTVTVISKPNNALFGEDISLCSKFHDNHFLSFFLSFLWVWGEKPTFSHIGPQKLRSLETFSESHPLSTDYTTNIFHYTTQNLCSYVDGPLWVARGSVGLKSCASRARKPQMDILTPTQRSHPYNCLVTNHR